MSTRRKPVVGETLYSLNVGNAARGRPQVLTPVVVTKVGRKYFYTSKVDSRNEMAFHIDGWYQNTGWSHTEALYESEQEYLDEKERDQIFDEARKTFEYSWKRKNLSLDQLRAIKAIINNA